MIQEKHARLMGRAEHSTAPHTHFTKTPQDHRDSQPHKHTCLSACLITGYYVGLALWFVPRTIRREMPHEAVECTGVTDPPGAALAGSAKRAVTCTPRPRREAPQACCGIVNRATEKERRRRRGRRKRGERVGLVSLKYWMSSHH